MDLSGAIDYLARAEARRIRPITDEDELAELDLVSGRAVPVIKIQKNVLTGRLQATGTLRHASHDNAPRLPFLVDWLDRSVLPLIDPMEAASVEGSWRIELHDSYSYLDKNAGGYREVLSFGRPVGACEQRVALFPDPYHIGSFGGMVDDARRGQEVRWESRAAKLFFAGTTTGNTNPLKNERISACLWSLRRRDISEFYLTNVAQINYKDACAVIPMLPQVMHKPFAIDQHFRYRYQVNIVGNTACWSRVPVLLSSGSLMVHVPHSDTMWYYPLLREREHYIATDSHRFDGEAMKRTHQWCLANDKLCRHISVSAANLARGLFVPGTAAAYAAMLLQEAGSLGRA